MVIIGMVKWLRGFAMGFGRWVLWTLLVLSLVVGAASMKSFAWLFAPLGDWASEFVYPNLTELNDKEPPLTSRQFPSSRITQAILGGRGDGLNCSIPDVGKALFASSKDSADVSLHFRPACVMHDMCYRHGFATYGYSQSDCDYALQESAYRMCGQITGTGNERVYKDCQAQARKVLLGVSLGGGSAFQAGSGSTYFEYDAMPEKADDYVIARAYDLTPEQAAAGELGVRTYHYRRNSVTTRILKVDAASPQNLVKDKSVPTTWPLQYTPAAPTLEWLGNGQSELIALSRKGAFNTNLVFVGFQHDVEKGKSVLFLKKCMSPLKTCPYDTDSGAKIANVEGQPVLLALRHHGSGSAGKSMELKQYNLATGETTTQRLTDTPSIGDRYRFLQNEVLLEKDQQGKSTHAWVLARGYSVENRQIITPGNGAGYKDRMLVVRQSLIDGQADTPSMINAEESDDPLALVRLASNQSALVGLTRTAADLPPVLTLWQAPGDGGPLVRLAPLAMPRELTASYIEHPPVVIDAPGKNNPVIVWTRVAQTARPTEVFFDLLLSELIPERRSLPTLGAVRCTLKLDEQLKTDIVKENAKVLGNTKKLARRWNMSQTLVSTRPSSDGAADLAVTTVFNGFPGLSFQVVLKNSPDGFEYSKVLPDAAHFDCGPATQDTVATR